MVNVVGILLRIIFGLFWMVMVGIAAVPIHQAGLHPAFAAVAGVGGLLALFGCAYVVGWLLLGTFDRIDGESA